MVEGLGVLDLIVPDVQDLQPLEVSKVGRDSRNLIAVGPDFFETLASQAIKGLE